MFIDSAATPESMSRRLIGTRAAGLVDRRWILAGRPLALNHGYSRMATSAS